MRCAKWLLGLLMVLVTFHALAQEPVTYAASFNCANASRPIKHTICQNADIAKLDLELAKIYAAATEFPDQKEQITSDQCARL